MFRRNQTGFTLIELILVMAISSSMLVIVLIGQRSLRSRAQFDAAVDRVVASVSQARNEATAGVNLTGTGDGTAGCTGAPGQTVFAGVALTADSAMAGGPLKLEHYKALPGGAACAFDSQTLSLPSTVSVTVGTLPAVQPGRIAYVRTNNGGVVVCRIPNITTDVRPMFAAGACSAPALSNGQPFNITLSDADGHTSVVLVDSSGLAKRQN